MRGRILITPRSLSNGHQALPPPTQAGFALVMPAPGATWSEAQLSGAVPGCVGWLAGVEIVSAAVIAAAESLRVVSRNGTGIDNLPLPEIEARGITVCQADGANAQGVAELALTLSLTGLRHVIPTHNGMKAGLWPRQIGRELSGALAHKYAGKPDDHRRMMAPPVTVEDLPRPDLVLITHAHTDHMDPDTLAPLARRFPDLPFVIPQARRDIACARIGGGVISGRLIGMDADESLSPLPGLKAPPCPRPMKR